MRKLQSARSFRPVAFSAALALIAISPSGLFGQVAQRRCGVNGMGGGGMELDGYNVAYAATRVSSGFTINGVVLARGAKPVGKGRPPVQWPSAWSVRGVPRRIAGASVGRIMVGYERATNAMWIDSLQVPLRANNLLLVDVDSTGTPRVVGEGRVAARVSESSNTACDATTAFEHQHLLADTLRARLEAMPIVRTFIRERQPNER
jgi:hypothetical protein